MSIAREGVAINSPYQHMGTALFIQAVSVHSKDLPAERNVLFDLEHIRVSMADLVSQAAVCDRNDESIIKKKVDDRYRLTVRSADTLRHRARSANATARALTEATAANGIEQGDKAKGAFSQWETAGLTEEVATKWIKFIRITYDEADKIAKCTESSVRSAVSASSHAVNSVMLGIIRRYFIRLILKSVIYVTWSILVLLVAVDYFQGYTHEFLFKELNLLLGHLQIDVEKNSTLIENSVRISVVVSIGIVVRQFFEPWLERGQRRFERFSLKRYISDEFNAEFTVRSYRVFVESSRLATLRALENLEQESQKMRPAGEDRPYNSVPLLVYKRAPSIESLSDVIPLPQIAEIYDRFSAQ